MKCKQQKTDEKKSFEFFIYHKLAKTMLMLMTTTTMMRMLMLMLMRRKQKDSYYDDVADADGVGNEDSFQPLEPIFVSNLRT